MVSFICFPKQLFPPPQLVQLCTKSGNLQTHLVSLTCSSQVTVWIAYWWAPHWVSIKQLSNFPLSVSLWLLQDPGGSRDPEKEALDTGQSKHQEPCCATQPKSQNILRGAQDCRVKMTVIADSLDPLWCVRLEAWGNAMEEIFHASLDDIIVNYSI